MNPESSKQGKDNSELTHIKPASNDMLSTINQNIKINNNPINNQQTQMAPVVFKQSGNNLTNEEIKSKIMSSKYCYIKQDLESFFSACLGCCSDIFKYKVYLSNQEINEIDKIDDAIFRVNDNEDCCIKINFCCSKLCKPVSLYLHPINNDSTFANFSFPCWTSCNCSCEICYSLGPPYSGYYGRDETDKFGEMLRRSHWCCCVDLCYESHRFYGISENSRFIVEKICCQLGGIPCSHFSGYYPLQFNILYNGNPVGTIIRNGKACCCGTKLYFFEILFPTIATFEERMLLIGFTLREQYLHYSQTISYIDNC